MRAAPARAAARRALTLTAISLAAGACAVHRFQLPAGPWLAAPDAAAIWSEATSGCRSTTAIRASLKISGRIGAQRVSGLASALASATFSIAVAADGSMGLNAYASGQPIFQMGGSAERAVLWWSDGPRTLTASAEDIVDALIGVRLSPRGLLAILDGCSGAEASFERGERSGALVRVTTGGGVVFLERLQQRWRIRAAQIEGFQVSYEGVGDPGPAGVRIDSLPGVEPLVELSLRVIDVERNPDPPIPAAAFVVKIPPGAILMTLDELRTWRDGGRR